MSDAADDGSQVSRLALTLAGAGLGLAGFVVWFVVFSSLVGAVLGLSLLFVGGFVAGFGGPDRQKGTLNAGVAMVLVIVGEFVVVFLQTLLTSDGSGLFAAAVAAVTVFVLAGVGSAVLVLPTVLLGRLGGRLRE